ncbi:hypothetical protein K788_0007296 [Paraburkholderia caribensis MBA4]|uniref:Uncharacterized protein n=1 Tax=Paraburkholderia caribensis MBA4 TaxID=1323664 RepID=A0A0N7JVI5_9BURK|nr:hypothetical protein K788_0007296 [Paraburkholderia caribensis MBA4]
MSPVSMGVSALALIPIPCRFICGRWELALERLLSSHANSFAGKVLNLVVIGRADDATRRADAGA